MSEELGAALERFERVMGARFPEWFEQLKPGLDDAGIERLRQGVAPLLLPAQVEQLYRWRSGGDRGVFGGWRLRAPDDLLRWYRFCVDELDEPPAWLPVFDDQMVNVVTLDLPGAEPSDTSVWYGHTHDAWVDRMFDSLAGLVETVCDAAEAGALTTDGALIGILEEHGWREHVDGPAWVGWRQARCPGTFQWPDPPAGTHLGRSPQSDWPAVWLASLGVDDAAQQSTGPTPRSRSWSRRPPGTPSRGRSGAGW
jgi:cell wall assembly regulator SMI1